jgi:hypothetical protein
LREPGLERLLGAALDHVQQPCRAGPLADAGQVDHHGDVLVPTPGVPPHVFTHADRGDAVEPGGVLDQDALALGQHRGVRGVPGDPKTFGHPRHRQVLAHDAFQRPPQPTPRQLRPRLGRPSHVLAPHVPAPGAPVAAQRHQQRRRSPAQRLVRKPPHNGVARSALAAATATPLVRIDDSACQHRTVGFESLAGDLEAELIETAELGQVGAGEGSVRHVEVLLDGQRRNSHQGTSTPTRTPPARRPPTPSTVMSP